MELSGRYSNPLRAPVDLDVRKEPPGRCGKDLGTRARQHQHRLRDPDINELVERYLDGASVYQLAVQFQIHRTTVSALLERRGVERRWRILDDLDVEQATAMYASGLSCASIAEVLGVHTNTIHRALTKAGVAMRAPHGRSR